jgi:transposase
MGRPNVVVAVSAAEAEQLRSIARSRSLPHALLRRARIVLMSAEGIVNQIIAERCGVSVPTISHWRRCWRERGIAGLHGELRPGRPRTYDNEAVAELIGKVLHSRPAAATHWSVRGMAAHTGISKSTVGATSSCSACSRIAARVSSFPPTRSSWRKSAMWPGCTSIGQIRRWSCAWMKNPRSRPWSAPAGPADGAGLRRGSDP